MFVCSVFAEQLESIDGLSLRGFAAKHNIAPTTFCGWYKNYTKYKETGELQLCGKRGRQALIDAEGLLKVKQKISELNKSQKSANKGELKKILVENINLTLGRRGYAPTAETLSDNAIKKYKELCDIGKGTVQHKTHARIVAEGDPRNALSMHALVVAFCTNLVPQMIGNFDATQFIVDQENPDEGYCIKQERADDNIPLTAESTGRLNFAIKYYHVNNGAGYTTPPVFNVALPEMGEGEFFVEKIHGLGSSRSQLDYGYVCFTKTRACNRKFYDWFARNVVVPFVIESRAAGDCKVINMIIIAVNYNMLQI